MTFFPTSSFNYSRFDPEAEVRKIQLARTEQRAQQRVESYAARLMGEYKLSPEQMADILRRAALVLVAGAARDGASER